MRLRPSLKEVEEDARRRAGLTLRRIEEETRQEAGAPGPRHPGHGDAAASAGPYAV